MASDARLTLFDESTSAFDPEWIDETPPTCSGPPFR
jgi:ABC-type polar amino acid transport system ATPase subunit